MSAQWCKNILENAIATHGKPEIVNSDQGSQYTSAMWTQYLEMQGIKISMDGKGRALDNVWIERFWKSLKYDNVCLNPADDGFELYEEFKTTSTIAIRKSITPLCKPHMTFTKNQ